jgi:TetR/AcrR family transcriptional regulator, transcriptional repressor for nem operon
MDLELAFTSRPVYYANMIAESPPRTRGRPPKMHPGFGETRLALIRAGVIALTEKGFPSTALEDILEAVRVPKGSFYHYFESKEAFGMELINSYDQYFARRLNSFLLNGGFRPLDRLRAFTLDAQAAMQRHDYKRGCLVGNLSQEMGALPASFRIRLIEILNDWQRRTGDCLRAAQTAKAIDASHDCDQLSAFFWIGWEGAVLRAKLEQRGEPLSVFASNFFMLLEK